MLPIRWRLTIFHALAIVVIAALLFGILAVVAIRGVTASVEEATRGRAAEATRLLETGAGTDPASLARLAEGNVFVVVRDGDGRVIAQTANPSAGYSLVAEEERDAVWRDVLRTGQPVTRDPMELHVHAVPVATDRSPARVVEAWKSYDETGENLIPFVEVTTFVIPAALILAVVGSYLLARSALAPVNAIAAAARAIGERDLAQRLPVAHPRDELGHLATTFNELLARLEVAFREREATLATQRRFVADASHELRTPLTSIQGYARMLRRWALDEADPAIAREGVAAIEREAARMADLVESLLRLARGDEGAPSERAPHDLRDVAAEAAQAARAAAGARIGVVYRPPADPVLAVVDRDRIHQVAAVLLDNALTHTPEGGTITVTVRPYRSGAELRVADTGPGIPEVHRAHVFERFYRVDPARTGGGAGLGLAIARQIAEDHGGTLDLVPSGDRGAVFSLKLPAMPEDATNVPPPGIPAAARPAPGGGTTSGCR